MIYPVGIVCIALLYERTALLAGCIVLLAAVTLLIDRRHGDLWVLLGGAVLGPVAEIVAVACGAWTYRVPDFLGIPLWLPLAWGLGTLLIMRISEGLKEVLSARGPTRPGASSARR